MKTPISDTARLQNTIDGLERLVLESTITPDELDSSELAQTESAMGHIFAASAARAKLTTDASERGLRGRSLSKTKRPNPLAVRLQELASMLLAQPDLEPRLRAVFESSQDVDSAEIEKVIEEVGNILARQDNAGNKAKSKNEIKARRQGEK